MFPTQALTIRPFRDLWLGQAISQLGDACYFIVFMFMVRRITGSDYMMGAVGAAEALPYLLFSGYAGVLADRMDRRRIMLLSDLLCGGLLLAFSGLVFSTAHPPPWSLVGVAFCLSTIRVFFIPAKSAAIPSLVPADMLMPANALSNMTQSFAPMIGLALAASVLAVLYKWSPTWYFALTVVFNAATFLVSALYVRRLPAVIPQREDDVKHPWTDFRQGLGYVRRHRVLPVFITINTLLGLFISPFMIVYVRANKDWFGDKPQTLAWMEVSFFVGLVVGSGLVAKFSHKRPGLGYSIALGIVGLEVAAMALTRSVSTFILLNVLAGLAIPFCDVPFNTYMQVAVEDAFRGRVNSAVNMTRMGIVPLSNALGAVMVARIGLVDSFAVMGLGMAGAALLGLASPAFRNTAISGKPESLEPGDSHYGEIGEAIAS